MREKGKMRERIRLPPPRLLPQSFHPHGRHPLPQFHLLPDSFLRYLVDLLLNPSSPDGDRAGDGDAPPPFFLAVSISGRDPLPRPTTHIDPISLLDSETFFSSSSSNDAGKASAIAAPSFSELEVAVERSIVALGSAAFFFAEKVISYDGDAPPPFLLPVSVSSRDPVPRPNAHGPHRP